MDDGAVCCNAFNHYDRFDPCAANVLGRTLWKSVRRGNQSSKCTRNNYSHGMYLTFSPNNMTELGLSIHKASKWGISTGRLGFHLSGYSNYKIFRPFVLIGIKRNTHTEYYYKHIATISGGLSKMIVNTGKMVIAPEVAPSYIVIIDERNHKKPQLVWGLGLNGGLKTESNMIMMFWNRGIYKGDIINSVGLGLMFQ